MPNRRRKHARKGLPWHRRSAIVLVSAVAIFFFAATTVLYRPFSPVSGISAISGIGKFVPLSIQEYAHKFPTQFYKLVYPYSIVPGGIGSAADARRAALSDVLVRTHYRNLDLDKLKPMNLAENRLAYVSYRMGDKVFWTAKRIRLPKGERMLTDGINLVRARCGNLVSDVPEQIASFGGPTEEALNRPNILSTPPSSPEESDGPNGPLEGLPPAELGPPSQPSSPTLTPSTLIAVVPDAPGDAFMNGFIPQGLPYSGSAVVRGPVPGASTEGSTPATPLTPPVTPPNNGGTTSPVVAPPVPVIPPATPPLTPPGGLIPPTVLPPRTMPGAPPDFPTSPNLPHRGNPSVTPPLVLPPDTPPDIPPVVPVTPPVPPAPPVSGVPEPSSWLMVSLGMCGLIWRARITSRGKLARARIGD